MNRPLPNSYWVVPGSLLAGEHPAGDAPPEARQRLKLLVRAGIDAFIDLTQVGERLDYRPLLPGHVHYLRSPIIDTHVPVDPAEMRAIQMHIKAMLAGKRKLYVHCRAGIGRTGTVIGCYLAEQGLDGAEALKQLNRLWRQSARSSSWPKVPQTPEQADYILQWARRRQPVATQIPGADSDAPIG
jgi:protein-tyrosine phosphatase